MREEKREVREAEESGEAKEDRRWVTCERRVKKGGKRGGVGDRKREGRESNRRGRQEEDEWKRNRFVVSWREMYLKSVCSSLI